MNKGIGIIEMVFGIFLYQKLAGIGLPATWGWHWVVAPAAFYIVMPYLAAFIIKKYKQIKKKIKK